MGSWLARELSGAHEVAVYDKDRRKLEGMKDVFPLAHIASLGGWKPDFLLNAVSLDQTVPVFEEVLPHLAPATMIGDVTSIKENVARYYRTAGHDFVSVHPMFGPTFADLGAPMDENAVIISESCPDGRKLFRDFLGRRGIRIFEYSFDEHDRMMAYSLTIPFVSSLLFSGSVVSKVVPGTTFKRHLAIARGLLAEDEHLLAEILFNQHSLAELERMLSRLEFLKKVIRAKDREELVRFLGKLRNNVERGDSDRESEIENRESKPSEEG